MAFIGCQVIPSLFLVLCPSFLRFLLAFLVFVSSFFPPSAVPILPKNIPKQETHNKNTFEISHPPKNPKTTKTTPKKKHQRHFCGTAGPK
jgi:hypothetical protein